MILEYRETVEGIERCRMVFKKRLADLDSYVDEFFSEEKYIESIVNLCNGKISPISKTTLLKCIQHEKDFIDYSLKELDENEKKINDLVYFCRTGKYPMRMEDVKIVIKMVFAA